MPASYLPRRVTVLWVLVSISAFTVLLGPLDFLGLDPVIRVVIAAAAGLVAGMVIARLTWQPET